MSQSLVCAGGCRGGLDRAAGADQWQASPPHLPKQSCVICFARSAGSDRPIEPVERVCKLHRHTLEITATDVLTSTCIAAANKLCVSNTQIKLKGINYFGFENGQTSFDGLWAGPTALSLGAHPPRALPCAHEHGAWVVMLNIAPRLVAE